MFFEKIKSGIFNKPDQSKIKSNFSGDGLVIFQVVEEAIKAEKLLKEAGHQCKLVAPPPSLRKGCDLALEIQLIEKPAIQRTLENGDARFWDIVHISGTLELLQIVKIIPYDHHTMVKAGNMKLVFETSSGQIVNTSGGGCPDIPYLNLVLVGKKLIDAPRPREIGFTLCSLMLDRAFEEALILWQGRTEQCS